MERKALAATSTTIYLAAFAAILVVINILSYNNFFRYDSTKEERFTLSLGSKRLVCEGLKQDLTVEVYVTKGLAKTDLFIQDVSDLLREYENAKYSRKDETGKEVASPTSKFKFTIIEPKTDEEKEAAKKEGLTEQLLGEGSETSDQATVATGFMGFVIKYGSEKEVIPFWPPESTQGIEFFLTNKIREVRDRADKIDTKFGILVGHEEMKLSDNVVAPGSQPFNVKQIFDEYFPFYKFEDVDLQNGDAEINKELSGIIVTQPSKDYSEKELRRIDEFLMLGDKAAVFYVSAVNMKAGDKDMKATLSTRGFEKLFAGYGVEMKKESVLDFGGAFRQPARTPMGQEVWVVAPGVTMLADDDSLDDNEKLFDPAFPAFFRMRQVAFPFPSTLVPSCTPEGDKKDCVPANQPGAKLKVVARTTPRSSVDATESQDMKYSTDLREKPPQEQRVVGVAIEGTLASAFAGKGDDMGIKVAATSPKPSRVLVVSSSQFLANPFARAGNPPPMPPQLQMMGGMGGDRELQLVARPYFDATFRPMIFSFKNTLDWMANDADLIAVSAKLLGEPTLTYSIKKPKAEAEDNEETMKKKFEAYKQERAAQQSVVSWTLALLPAVLFALFGIGRWRMREANREKAVL